MLSQNTYTTKCLEAGDIQSFLDLQGAVPAEKQKFVKPRTAEDLQAHMDAGMPVMGVYDGNKLVAAALLTYPENKEATKFLDGYPLSLTTAVVQSVSAIQKGTMPTLMDFAKDLARDAGYNLLVAKVNSENECGVNAFSRQDFDIIETTPDPLGGGYTAHFMRAVIAPTLSVPVVEAETLHGQGLPAYQFPTGEPPEESQPVHTGC